MSFYGPGQNSQHLVEIRVLNEEVSRLRGENGTLRQRLSDLSFEFDKLGANPDHVLRLRAEADRARERVEAIEHEEREATRRLLDLLGRIDSHRTTAEKLRIANEALGTEAGHLIVEGMARRDRKNRVRGILLGLFGGVPSSLAAAGLLEIDPADFLQWLPW